MAAAPVTIADLTSALSELRREIPSIVQPLVVNSISLARVEISAELQAALTDLNDRALKQIEPQAAAIKLAADAQQIEIGRLVEQAANEKFETAAKAFKSEQEETRTRMVTFGERMATYEEAVKLVADGGFERFVQQLEDQRRATETIIDSVHRTLTASSTQSVSELRVLTSEQFAEFWSNVQTKFHDVDAKIDRTVA